MHFIEATSYLPLSLVLHAQGEAQPERLAVQATQFVFTRVGSDLPSELKVAREGKERERLQSV